MRLVKKEQQSKERRIIEASPPRTRFWGKLILALIIGVLLIFGISRYRAHTRHSQSADAQWALNNLSIAQRAYFEAHKSFTVDYERLARFGFQEYGNINYSAITIHDDDPNQPGWRAQVKYKSRQAVTYTYDSTKGGFLDIIK